jgi:hypothetical protein
MSAPSMPAAVVNASRDAPSPAEAEAGRPGLRWLVPEMRMLPVAARRCVVRNQQSGALLELSSGEYAVLSA